MSDWIQAISAIGTLLLGAIALFAIFYPGLVSWYKKPKFTFHAYLTGEPPKQIQLLGVVVTNHGKRIAHDLVGLIKIYDSNQTLLSDIRIRENLEAKRMLYQLESVHMYCIESGQLTTVPSDTLRVGGEPVNWILGENETYSANLFVGCEELSQPSRYEFKFQSKAGRINLLDS